MSSPQAIFFDTGALIALFNVNKSEQPIADAIYKHLEKIPHASRHVVSPSMVELFYRLRKVMSPLYVQKNLDLLGITFFPISYAQELDFFNSYCEIPYKNEFDYADYFICRAALAFKRSQVLTIDRDDLPLALTKAYEKQNPKSKSDLHLIPFKI